PGCGALHAGDARHPGGGLPQAAGAAGAGARRGGSACPGAGAGRGRGAGSAGRARRHGTARSLLVQVRSGAPEDTEALAAALAAELRAGDVVTVSGELGAGKTTFVRGA